MLEKIPALVLATMAFAVGVSTESQAAPEPLIAIDDRVVGLEDQELVIRLSHLLTNDRSASADPILDRPPAFGRLDASGTKEWRYLPDPGFHGTVTFTYFLSGRLTVSESATVVLHILPKLAAFGADWDGDGYGDLGVYEPGASMMHFCDAPVLADSPDFPPAVCTSYPFHPAAALSWPVAADRDGDGDLELGLFDPVRLRFEFFTVEAGHRLRHVEFEDWREPGDLPLIGDWNGDGRDELAVYRATTHDISFDRDAEPPWDVELELWPLGKPGNVVPFGGDWANAGFDTPAFYVTDTGLLALYRRWSKLPVLIEVTRQVDPNAIPIVGCWQEVPCDAVAAFETVGAPVLRINQIGPNGPGRVISIPIQIGGGGET